jgi:hypothetical protein
MRPTFGIYGSEAASERLEAKRTPEWEERHALEGVGMLVVGVLLLAAGLIMLLSNA